MYIPFFFRFFFFFFVVVVIFIFIFIVTFMSVVAWVFYPCALPSFVVSEQSIVGSMARTRAVVPGRGLRTWAVARSGSLRT